MNITELLSVILKGMSKESIELTDVELYDQAVDINNQVKVCIWDGRYSVDKINESGGFSYYFADEADEMVDKVIELLEPAIKKGDSITDGEQSGVLIEVVTGRYHIVDLRMNKTIYWQNNTLGELKRMGWKKA